MPEEHHTWNGDSPERNITVLPLGPYPKGSSAMDEIVIPSSKDICGMPRLLCERERIRLKNEVSFARGNAMCGGPSADTMLAELKRAIEAIEARLGILSSASNAECPL